MNESDQLTHDASTGPEVEVQSQAYYSARFLDNFWLSWIFLYLLSVVATIVVNIAKSSMKSNVVYLENAQLIECVPALVCLIAVYTRATVTEFSNRVCALNLWIAMVSFFEKGPVILSRYWGPATLRTGEELVWLSLGLWQLMALLAVNVSRGSEPSFLVTSALLGLIIAGLNYTDEKYIHVDESRWYIVTLSLLTLGRTAYALLYRDSNLNKWLEFYGSLLALGVIGIHLIRAGGYTIGKIENSKVEDFTITIDNLWLSEHLMRWMISCAFTYSAVTQDA
jgi:hypothetical protein